MNMNKEDGTKEHSLLVKIQILTLILTRNLMNRTACLQQLTCFFLESTVFYVILCLVHHPFLLLTLGLKHLIWRLEAPYLEIANLILDRCRAYIGDELLPAYWNELILIKTRNRNTLPKPKLLWQKAKR